MKWSAGYIFDKCMVWLQNMMKKWKIYSDWETDCTLMEKNKNLICHVPQIQIEKW